MSNNKKKPSRWYYVLALFIPIFACVGTAFIVYRSVPKLPGALEAAGIQNLKQVIVPGTADIRFPKEGAYAVYYEYRSVIDGVSYIRDKYPPSMRCQLTSKTTGENIELTPNYIEGNMYETQNPERTGVLIMSISINQPGTYKFSCQYPDGSTNPKNVLAVGPNIAWEFLNIAAKPVAASIGGALAFMCACGLSLLIIGIVAFKRYQPTSNSSSQA